MGLDPSSHINNGECVGMDKIASARLLLKAVKDLEASLLKPYEEYPANPETEFLNALTSVSFFSHVVFKDLVSRQGQQISANWAMLAAIALGDFDVAYRFLDIEILDITNEGQDLAQLEDIVATALKNHNRSERWQALLTKIERSKAI